MTEFQRLDIKQPPKARPNTAEDRYWKSFKNAASHKHFVKVTDIQFAPLAPHDVAACASTRVTLYDPASLEATKSITRFRDVALSASFRPDGRILSASSQDGLIQSFDLSSRAILRSYAAHSGPVWSVHHGKGFGSLYSGGDDCVVRLWDVASGQQLQAWRGHADYVRVVRELPEGEAVLVSGSYDGTLRWWDRRLSAEDACVGSVRHGAPVSALVLIPQSAGSSSLSCISAGDVTLKAWDLRLLSSSSSSSSASSPPSTPVLSLSSHQKTITCLTVDASCSRLISGSLDAFLKVTALPSFSPLSSIRHASPVLAVGLSPDSTTLAIGSVEGSLTLRQRLPPPPPIAPKPLPRMGSQAWFSRGIRPSPLLTAASSSSALSAPRDRRQLLKAYDVYLKRFQYHAALDAALRTDSAAVAAAMLDELVDRSALSLALAGRDEAGLRPLLSFLLHQLSHPLHSQLTVDVTAVLLRLYGGELGGSVVMDEWLRRLADKVKDELQVMEIMMRIRGGLEMIWRGGERMHGLQQARQQQQAEGALEEVKEEAADEDGAEQEAAEREEDVKNAAAGADEGSTASVSDAGSERKKKTKHSQGKQRPVAQHEAEAANTSTAQSGEEGEEAQRKRKKKKSRSES